MENKNHVQALAIPVPMAGAGSFIFPTLIWDDWSVILVDTGFPGQLPEIHKSMQKIRVPFERLSKVILTHHDIDHIGSLSAIVQALPGQVEVLAHEDEKDFIEGKKIPLKLGQLESQLDTLSPDRRQVYERLKAGFSQSFTPVDRILSDGERLDWCGGIQVILTPGHTFGHICLYLQDSRTLIAGDTLQINDGRLAYTSDAIHYDPAQYRRSLQKLKDIDIDQVICYHSGVFSGEVKDSIKELISNPSD